MEKFDLEKLELEKLNLRIASVEEDLCGEYCDDCGTDENVSCVEIEPQCWIMTLCEYCEEEYR